MTSDDAQPEEAAATTQRPSVVARLWAAAHWFFARPGRQVGTLAVVSCLSVVAVAAVAVVEVNEAKTELDAASREYDPLVAKLTEAKAAYVALGVGIAELVETPVLGSFAPRVTEARALWDDYKKSSLRLPGESELIDAANAAQATALVNATDLFQGVTPARVAQSQADLAALDRSFQGIQDLYAARSRAAVSAASDQLSSAQNLVYAVSAVALMNLFVLFGLAMNAALTRQRYHERREAERASAARRADLETRLQRALEMVRTEEQAFTIVGDVLSRAVEVEPAEVLVADSSRAHFHQVATTDAESLGPGCPVGEPRECPAANRGQTQVFPSSTDIDACPYLRDRSGPSCAAVCVPMSIAGKTVGVIHTTAPDRAEFDRETVMSLELVARKAGDRIGMIRAFERSETQARTDPLTGLLNRRSLEDAVRKFREETPYAVVYGDLDHFKMLNDVHGHDAGDRALRVFARVLRDSVRPSDIPARYGGEEFVVVLPDCQTDELAVDVVERVRARLHAAQEGSPTPSFTVSFGVALSEPGAPFSEIVDAADQALLLAKASGRDRVVVSGTVVEAPDPGVDPDPEPSSEPVPAT